MIKSIFLNHKSKSKGVSKDHCTYLESVSIGLLYNAEEFENEAVEGLIDTLEGDGKSVAKLGFVEKPTEQRFLFSKKDISGTGAIKKDSIQFFANQAFDFLISLDTTENINYKYILAISKATCKIGFETESYSDLLQMSLKPDEQQLIAVRNMVKYLKMI